LDVKLEADGKPLELNEFAAKILGGTIAGTVTSLRWREIKIEVTRMG